VKRAYKFRFYPTPEQESEFIRTWGCVRLVYNKTLEYRNAAWFADKKRVSYANTDKLLTTWKRDPELAFLSEVSSVPLQQCLRHLQTAYVKLLRQACALSEVQEPQEVAAVVDVLGERIPVP
jgi:putative transposase